MDMLLAEVGVRCDRCGTSFVSRQLPTFIDIGHRNSELRQDYRGYQPMMEQYAIISCPSCGRADWSTAFPPAQGKPVLAQANTSAHMQYRQAALDKERNTGSVNSFQAAVFYVHAAWCADDSKAFPQAREYRRLAIESYKRSLSDNTCPQNSRGETEYLIGELMRRAGDFEGAREHFRMCIGRLNARFAIMARKLMRLCEQGSTEAIQFEADAPMQPASPPQSGANDSSAGGFASSAANQAPAAPVGAPPAVSAASPRASYSGPPASSGLPGASGSSGSKRPPDQGPPEGPPVGPPGSNKQKSKGPPTQPPPGAPPLA
jgi:uncharacterized protein (DUF2225 family)